MTYNTLCAMVEHTKPEITVTAASYAAGQCAVTIWVWRDDDIYEKFRAEGATLDEAAKGAWVKVMSKLLQPEPEDHPLLFEEEHDRL